MSYRPDPRVDEAKQIPIEALIDRLAISGLRRTGAELIGPCPICGGTDRFGINIQTLKFLCRQCDIRGGDQIALAMAVNGLDFRDALTWLCGDEQRQIDTKEEERRRRAAEAKAREQERQQAKFRQWAINAAKETWRNSVHVDDGYVRGYLAKRGFSRALLPEIPLALRESESLPYMKKIASKVITMHEGPAMIAAVQHPDRQGRAVHRTWIDLAQPTGKAKIIWQGEEQKSKLVWGSKKGGSIRLLTPDGANALVMGEGIETTLSAMVAGAIEGAAYWAGVDLGNMSGKMTARNSGIPDMSDKEAFVPPPWVKRLVFIMDGDSEPKMTRAKLESGLRRAAQLRAGLECKIVQAPKGADLNDMLTEAGNEHAS